MPELDDDLLFGDGADDERDDDLESRGDDEDESEGDEDGSLEDQFSVDEEYEKPAKSAAKGADTKGGDRSRGDGGGKTVTLSAKEYKELQQKAREVETEREYWRGRAEASKGRKSDDDDGVDDPAPAKTTARKAAPKEEDEDDADLLDAISKGGTKALKARGFVRMSDVEALIEERSAAIAERIATGKVKQATEALHSDAQLLRAYPELNDAKSEFSERVGQQVRELVAADKSLAKSNSVIAVAARIVKAEMVAESKSKRGREDERERRISKQTPSGGRGGDGDEPYMSPMQRRMLEPMLKGLGVSEKDYRQETAKMRGRR